jgi:hypothetical protein
MFKHYIKCGYLPHMSEQEAEEKIYLQWFGTDDPLEAKSGPAQEVTWCQHKQFDTDVEYQLVRKRGAELE